MSEDADGNAPGDWDAVHPTTGDEDDHLAPPTTDLGLVSSPSQEQPEAETEFPESLLGSFTDPELLTVGTEGTLFRARAIADNSQVVIKLYFRGVELDERLHNVIANAGDAHVVGVRHRDRVDGRNYEVLDYLQAGSLTRLIRNEGPTFPTDTIREVIRELLDALRRLSQLAYEDNGKAFVHGDIKPDNILVRQRSPLVLVLADFGSSLVTERSRVFVSKGTTLHYAAPELLSGARQAEKTDVWNLGVIAFLMSTGEHPLSGLDDERAIRFYLGTKNIDTRAVEDPEINRLCRGLLVRDPSQRWGYDEVAAWLDGEKPPVPEQRQPRVTDGPTFEFDHRFYTDPTELALAMGAHWGKAAESISGPRGRKALKQWLDKHLNRESVRRLLDEWEPMQSPEVDVILVLLLVHLAPDAPQLPFRGWRIDGDGLESLARQATRRDTKGEQARAAVKSLANHNLLALYGRLPDHQHLAVAGEQWAAALEDFEESMKPSRPHRPGMPPSLVDEARPRLLIAVLNSAEREQLRQSALDTAEDTPTDQSPWFVSLVETLQREHGAKASGRQLAVQTLAPLALEQSESAAEERERARIAAEQRESAIRRDAEQREAERRRDLRNRDRRTVKWIIGLTASIVLPVLLGYIILTAETIEYHRNNFLGWPNVLYGLPGLQGFIILMALGTAVIVTLGGFRLLARRPLRERGRMPLLALLGMLLGLSLLWNREWFVDNALDAALTARLTNPVPLNAIPDLCPNHLSMDDDESVRIVVRGPDCNEIRQYQAWVPGWATPTFGEVEDLRSMGPVIVATSTEWMIGLDSETGEPLWGMVCADGISVEGSSERPEGHLGGRCDGEPFEFDVETGP